MAALLETKMAKTTVKPEEELFMGICHDLKAPLQIMLGFNAINHDELEHAISMMRNDDQTVLQAIDSIRRNIDIISTEGTRLVKMVDDLMDICYLEQAGFQFKLEPCTVRDIMDSIQFTITPNGSKGVEFKLVLHEPLPQVMAHKCWISRVLTNLISNAFKYTEKGTIICSSRAAKGKVLFIVEDTGIGIPLEFQGRVFDKFVRVPYPFATKGTGIGLTIAKFIVEGHGGEIWLESQTGKGSKFCFTIPAAKQ